MSVLKPTLENLAERIAASQGGSITPSDLAPHLPVSLTMIEKYLDEMVDDSVVRVADRDGIKTYEFVELLGAEPKPIPKGLCTYCGDDAPTEEENRWLCYACTDTLGRELLQLAESTAWPAEAVWQHELLYITSTAPGPIRIAEVAGRSRMTLSQVKQRLRELAERGLARQVVDDGNASTTFEFPPLRYPRRVFQRHDKFIRLHPSSFKDEWEVKIIKSLLAFVGIVAACFALALAGIPFPLLAPGGAGVFSLAVWRIARRKTNVEPGRIGKDEALGSQSLLSPPDRLSGKSAR